MKPFPRLLLIVAVLLPGTGLRAAISMPAIFSDHMVLQQGQPVPLWGTAEAGESLEIRFHETRVLVQADAAGNWKAFLPPMAGSAKPGTLTVTGSTTRVFKDVLVGEVWLASGQSNMEKPIGEKKGQSPTRDHETVLRNARDTGIRLFQVPHYGEVKKPDWEMRWLVCTPETLRSSGFSAVGYHFARTLREKTDVPVGVIHSSFGGSMIEAWMPEAAFRGNPLLEPLLQRRFFAWVEGVQATELFGSMIFPLAPYGLRGFLWYQGEANVMYAESAIYTRKMQALIHGWRKAWNAPEAPFLYVQLAPFNYSEWDKFPRQLTPEALPLFREAQAAALAVPGTGMVVTTDLAGEARDIHPVQKAEVGERLARLFHAMRDNTGQSRNPRLGRALIDADQFVLKFHHTSGHLQTRDGEPVTGFEIAGADRRFHPAVAVIDESRVRVRSPQVSRPVAVRFAWHETANPNLVSGGGLPVTPFRTDNWTIKNEK